MKEKGPGQWSPPSRSGSGFKDKDPFESRGAGT